MSDKSDLPLVIIGLGAAYLIITSITTPAAAVGQAAAEWWDDMFGGAPQPDDLADSAFPGRIAPTPEGFLPSNITWDLVDSDGREISVGLPFGYTPETWCAAYPTMDFCRIVRGVPIPARPPLPDLPVECYTYFECCLECPGDGHNQYSTSSWDCGTACLGARYLDKCGCTKPGGRQEIIPRYKAWRDWEASPLVISSVVPPPDEDVWYAVVWSWIGGLWEGALEWVRLS